MDAASGMRTSRPICGHGEPCGRQKAQLRFRLVARAIRFLCSGRNTSDSRAIAICGCESSIAANQEVPERASLSRTKMPAARLTPRCFGGYASPRKYAFTNGVSLAFASAWASIEWGCRTAAAPPPGAHPSYFLYR